MADDNEDEVELDPAVLLVPALLPGDRCRVFIGGGEGSGSTGALDSDQQAKLKAKADKGVGRSALVKYVGQVPGMPRGYWIGVQYDEKVGKNDGMLNGRRFFRCPAGHGGFVRSTKVVKVDPPQTSEAAAPPAPPATVPPGAPPVEGGATTGATPTGGSPSPPKPRLPIEGRLEEVAGTAISDPSFDRYDLLTPHGPNGSESPTRADGSMASRIARRRKELATQRSQRSTRSPLEMRGKRTMCQLTLSEWQERVAPLRADGSATPTQTYATGPELDKAVVGTLAQFTILARSAAGEQVAKGGDNIEVVMRGIGGANNSQPALLHTKIIDRGDGSYICEFRPWLTGTFGVWITLDGCNITGSPYELSVITLRPDASRCVVRGDALHRAVARTPMKFEVLFVDAKGHPTFAEDLDVYVEEIEGAEGAAAAGGDAAGASLAGGAADALLTSGGTGEEAPGGSALRAVRSRSPRKSARGTPRSTPRRVTSLSPRGRISTASYANGYSMLEAPIRQQHISLWASRQAADKRLARLEARGKEDAGRTRKLDLGRSPTSFAHELSVDPQGFAFGGCDPGTLHAHGKIFKVHQVHYSVGLAGRYRLHVGLRHQMLPLPGSPFELLVEPGKAYAASTKLPTSSLPLSGVASEDLQHGMVFKTADMLGNFCTKGGSDIVMQLSKRGHDEHSAIHCEVIDNNDGSYELKWRSAKAGVFPIDVLMDGAHVVGSPTELMVRSAKPAVEQMAVSGVGIAKAVAGNQAELHVRVADRFGNQFEAGTQNFPYSFGLLLNPSGLQMNDKADKKSKQAKGFEKVDGPKMSKMSKQDEKKAPSLPFKGQLSGSDFEIYYVAEEAGAMDLHLWAETTVEGREPERVALPGSPFTVVVSEGHASAKGSFVGEAEAAKQGAGFISGEHVILRPQVRDPFGNPSTPPDGALTAEHVRPGTVGNWEELPTPKLKGGLGSYEVIIEPIRSGTHLVYVKLDGQDISGSPVSFDVEPAGPSSNKCKVTRVVPPENDPIIEKSPIAILVTLFDKYGNQLDHGGVRVDAKASGVGVSGAKVEDNKDGTYTISLTAGPPGEIKVTVRIDGNDLPSHNLLVLKNPEQLDAKDAAAEAAEAAPEAAEPVSKPATGARVEQRRGTVPANATAKEKEKDAPQDKEAPPPDSVPESPATPAKESVKEPVLKEIPWMTQETLLGWADKAIAQAAELESEADGVHVSFEIRLGNAILEKLGTVGKLADLVREWDKNMDGDISKIEFRQVVTDKRHLNMKASNAEIDGFFATMDTDGGGSLEFAELKPALKSLQVRSSNANAEAQRLRDRAEVMREKAEKYKKAAAVTEAVEEEELRLNKAASSESVAAKLGAKMMKLNLKLGEVVSKWDSNADGFIDRKEFRAIVLGMIEAHPLDIDKLFDELDADSGGSLDLDEIKKSFSQLMNAAAQRETELKDLKKAKDKLRKAAVVEHKTIAMMHLKDEIERKEAEAAAKRAAEEKAAADAEAKRLAKEAKEAAARAKAEEKAAMIERAKQRNESTKDAVKEG